MFFFNEVLSFFYLSPGQPAPRVTWLLNATILDDTYEHTAAYDDHLSGTTVNVLTAVVDRRWVLS